MPTQPLSLALAACLVASASLAETPAAVTFGSMPARVGDRVDQNIRLELRLKSRVRRDAEVLKESQSEVVHAHTRRVTTTEVVADRRVAATVAYTGATEEAVAGKTYHCRRVDDTLQITDDQGVIPTVAEHEIVSRHMQMLGRPNPLAEYLGGKTVTVGETLSLPREVAVALFGAASFGDVERFDLTLAGVLDDRGPAAARFNADISVAASDGTQTRMEIGGPMVIEAAT
ncbi:MAG: hypothetical protein AAF596_07185, partial [Planctomycetota bacterium]